MTVDTNVSLILSIKISLFYRLFVSCDFQNKPRVFSQQFQKMLVIIQLYVYCAVRTEIYIVRRADSSTGSKWDLYRAFTTANRKEEQHDAIIETMPANNKTSLCIFNVAFKLSLPILFYALHITSKKNAFCCNYPWPRYFICLPLLPELCMGQKCPSTDRRDKYFVFLLLSLKIVILLLSAPLPPNLNTWNFRRLSLKFYVNSAFQYQKTKIL